MKATVVESYMRSYANPIAFARGDAVTLTGKIDVWQGHAWAWAVGADGREGWIPPESVSPRGVALQDYSALELTVCVGEVIEVLMENLGWCLCRNSSAQQGWVPSENLRFEG
jgi:Tfp pilus assembly protein FimT